MKLVTYGRANTWRAGFLVEDSVVDVASVAAARGWDRGAESTWLSVRRLLRDLGSGELAELHTMAREGLAAFESRPIADVTLGPPVTDPQKIVCIGLNYALHVEEVGLDASPFPEIFAKFPNTLVGAYAAIQMPAQTSQLDYEGELALVIGKRAKDVPPEKALDHVAGYMVLNDVSARDLQMRGNQWLPGKSCDSFAPCGPALVTPEEVDLEDLEIVTRVNGEVRQKAPVADMTVKVPGIIAELSMLMTLEVGDVIATGTPSGVGMSYDPPRFLRVGDEVSVQIGNLGTIRNTVQAAQAEDTGEAK